MRDPKRIPEILKELQELWEKYPDMRLSQLFYNLPHLTGKDFYHVEDKEFIKLLKDFYGYDTER